MHGNDLRNRLAVHSARLEAALRERLPLSRFPAASALNDALAYAAFPGGKRLRPMATLLVGDCLGVQSSSALLRAACAMEYLHTSSLIFDDLPAMDDASARRERPPLHRVYGEGIALLAALAFLNQSYRLMAESVREEPPQTRDLLFEELCHCIGSDGMIGGQSIDISLRGASSISDRQDCNFKTTSLTRLMLSAGAIVCHAPTEQVRALAEFGHQVGATYQQLDDWMDEEADARSEGRPAHVHAEERRLACHAALRQLELEKDSLCACFERGQLNPLLLYVQELFGAFRASLPERIDEHRLPAADFAHD